MTYRTQILKIGKQNAHAASAVLGATWLALMIAGCSDSGSTGSGKNDVGGSSSTSSSTGNANTGGRSSATSSAAATGGATQAATSGAATGGAKATGGATSANVGGTTAGNTKATGGAKNTGGTKAGGGSAATGGTKAGDSSTNGVGGATSSTSTQNGGATGVGGTQNGGGATGVGGTQSGGGATGVGGTTATSSSAPPPPTLEAYTSTNNTWTKATPTAASSGTPDVTVNDTEAQTWEGFGGAFNDMGWSVLTSDEMKSTAMKYLFGNFPDGAHFVWGRIPMGASDYGTKRYTLDDPDAADPQPPAARPTGDTSLAKFTITNGHDDKYLIPYIKAAKDAAAAAGSSIRFWASPWTPPIWMKTGYMTKSGGTGGGDAKRPSYFDGGKMGSDNANLQAYAQYFVKFVDAYKGEGINIEVVSPQNEPGYEQNYPSCLWDSATYVSFFKLLGAAMEPKGVKLMLGTMSNNGDNSIKDLDIAKAVLNDSAAKAYAYVAGAQWGVLGQVVTDKGTSFGGLKIWATEHKCGNYPWVTTAQSGPPPVAAYDSTKAPNDQAYGYESWYYIRDAINQGKVTAYNAWNMVLDKLGLGNDLSRDWRQNTLLVADSGKVNTTQAYNVFRHFGKVDPGDKVVSTSGGDAVAFKKPDGTVVVVMYSASAKTNYTVKAGSKLVQFNMPASGWATVVIPAS